MRGGGARGWGADRWTDVQIGHAETLGVVVGGCEFERRGATAHAGRAGDGEENGGEREICGVVA